MKKLFALLLVAMLIFLVGCGNVSEKETSDETDSAANSDVQETNYEIAALEDEIQEAEERLKSELVSGSKVLISKGFQRAEVGDVVPVVLGIRNDFISDHKFRPEIKFIRSYDNMNNPIEVDDDTMMEWVSYKTEKEIALENRQIGFLTIYFEVKDEIMPGTSPKKGSYAFSITAQYDEDPATFVDYGSSKQIAIQIQ